MMEKNWHSLRVYLRQRNQPIRTGFRLLVWAVYCALGLTARIRFPKWRGALLLSARWHGVHKLLFLYREEYEFELGYLERVLAPGQVFIDAGACLGVYTLLASRLVGPGGRVFAFEPAAESFAALERNTGLNALPNVCSFRLALSDRAGTDLLYHYVDQGCHSLGAPVGEDGSFEEIRTATLDEVLEQAAVEEVDVIKLDVEGSEESVLRGAVRTIRRSRPLVIFEVNSLAASRQGRAADGAWRFLEAAGYRFFEVQPDGQLRDLDRPPENRNAVAIHRQPRRARSVEEETEDNLQSSVCAWDAGAVADLNVAARGERP